MSTGCLTPTPSNSYNNSRAEVAQSVEQRTENPRVPSSILGLGTTSITGPRENRRFLWVYLCGSGSAVEHLLAKERVASSNLVFRLFSPQKKTVRLQAYPACATPLYAVKYGNLRHAQGLKPKWRNRQTRQSQKLLGGNSRVGSNPTFGTISDAEWCSGSTGDFGSLSPGSNPGSAATLIAQCTPPHPRPRLTNPAWNYILNTDRHVKEARGHRRG